MVVCMVNVAPLDFDMRIDDRETAYRENLPAFREKVSPKGGSQKKPASFVTMRIEVLGLVH